MNDLQDFEYLKFQYEKDLHDVFGTVLDTFPDIKGANVQGQIYLWELLQKIKYNFLQDIDINTYLLNKYINGRRSTEYDERKEQLPAICYNAKFNGYKDLKHLKSITNLMFLDIDDFRSKEEALAYKTHIVEKYNWILACNLSLSKLGLHVIIMVDKINGNKDYNYKYDYISKEYFNGKLDKDSKSLTRYTVVPYDFNIYINECPNVLDIEHIIRNSNKGIRSAYIQNGVRAEEERIISTAYTFSATSQVKELMNIAGRKNNLKFRQEACETLFQDPNIPLYIHEGIDVISINLYPYRDTGVKDGHRTVFLGAITAQMIYLNAIPDNTDPKIREDILKFILSINKKICDPTLSYKEVLNSYNANWKSYDAGELDISKYFRKQKAFWSRNATIKGNAKRKVTCKIKNEPIVAESRKKIADAIEDIHALGKKITQKNVSLVSGLKLPTVKKYRDYYNELLNNKKMNNKNDCAALNDSQEPDNNIGLIDSVEMTDIAIATQKSHIDTESDGKTEFKNPEIIDVDEDTLVFGELGFSMTDNQIHSAYDRIFHSHKRRLDKHQEELLFTKFVNRLDEMPKKDLKLLSVNIDDINDSTTFFKQSILDSKFWDLCDDLLLAKVCIDTI